MFTITLCRQYLQSPEYKENRFILCPYFPEGVSAIHRDPNSKVFRTFNLNYGVKKKLKNIH